MATDKDGTPGVKASQNSYRHPERRATFLLQAKKSAEVMPALSRPPQDSNVAARTGQAATQGVVPSAQPANAPGKAKKRKREAEPPAEIKQEQVNTSSFDVIGGHSLLLLTFTWSLQALLACRS